MQPPDLYSPQFVRELFDEMSRTYGVVNLISSFGFCRRWRRQCVAQLDIAHDAVVYDLMTGMGELWASLTPKLGADGRIRAVDLSPVMCTHARTNAARRNARAGRPVVDVLEEDMLACSLPDASADVVISSFGLKTFSPDQHAVLAAQVARVLRPGGRFSFLEISVPPSRLMRWPYIAYVRYVIPMIGQLLLGNPDNYRMLGVYTSAFGDCGRFATCCVGAGLRVEARSFFFGCATGVVGEKPLARPPVRQLPARPVDLPQVVRQSTYR